MGSSMGRYIAQLLAAQYTERVPPLTLMMSSMVSISLEHAFLEDWDTLFSLPLPTKQFVDSLRAIGPIPRTQEGLINYILSIWLAYNRLALPYEPSYWYSLAKAWVERMLNLSASYNHRLAVNPINRETDLRTLNLPTLIIHGSVDPFFPLEHAYALQKAISSSSLVIIVKTNHLFHEAFIEVVLNVLLPHLQTHD